MQTNVKELKNLLVDFHDLTGMKISVFDGEGTEVTYYPDRLTSFCSYIRENKEIEEQCLLCDSLALKKCTESGKVYIYTCHAGLFECITPVITNGVIRGYVALGQVKSESADIKSIVEKLKKSGLNEEVLIKTLMEVQTVEEDKLMASAHILQACAGYEQLKEFIAEKNMTQKETVVNYINIHLRDNLDVDVLCKSFKTSRIELYNLFKTWFSKTPADYVRESRLNYAGKLLKNGSKKINEIAEICGIGDYNYFSKLFKKHFGVTPREYRNGD